MIRTIANMQREASAKPRIIGSRFNIRPNMIVRSNIWFSSTDSKRHLGRSTDKNLANNEHSGAMSAQSEKKIRSAINWLCASARQKWVSETPEHKGFYFKVNFITLTLPALNTHITHENIFNELIAPFLDYARKTWKLNNYVWKIELQGNGNPHVHITSDTYINHRRLRERWNYQLKKLGILSLYTAKYLNCSFSDYSKWHPPTDLVDIAKTYERWQYGNSVGWLQPNSTDIHAVKNIRDLAAYLSKYMAKDINAAPMVRGLSALAQPTSTARMWSCSQELSKAFHTVVEDFGEDPAANTGCLYNGTFQVKHILGEPDRLGMRHPIVDIIFVKPHQWLQSIKGSILNEYTRVKNDLRNAFLTPIPILS